MTARKLIAQPAAWKAGDVALLPSGRRATVERTDDRLREATLRDGAGEFISMRWSRLRHAPAEPVRVIFLNVREPDQDQAQPEAGEERGHE